MKKAKADQNDDLLELDEHPDSESKNNNDIDDEDGIEYNIIHVSKEGDLSPKHTNILNAKKGSL